MAAFLLALPLGCTAQSLVDVGAERGILDYHMAPPMGAGLAAADIDNDLDIDLFVPNAEDTADQLYLNDGSGTFSNTASAAGLNTQQRARAALWFDMDGDRDLDLVKAGDCFGEWGLGTGDVVCRPGRAMLRLYRQESNGVFVNVTTGSGLEQDSGILENAHHRGGLAAGDLDQDGDLDLYSAFWRGPSRLYFNDGTGHFTDVTVAAGVHRPGTAQWQPVILDVDGDGRQDIFVAVDFTANFLFMNQGNGQFEDHAAAAGVNQDWNDMGVAVGDADNDGDFDLYVTQVHGANPEERNLLLRNDSVPGTPLFVEHSQTAGVADTSWGWGATFADMDLDGDLDLLATNGFDSVEGAQYPTDPSRAFRNDGDGTYTDVSAAWGFNDTLWGSGLIAFDFDRDGRLDLLQATKVHPNPGPLRLLRNTATPAANFLRVVPRSMGPNSQAIGARVSVRIGSQWQHRLITAGLSFLSQEPAEAHFGLAGATRVDELRVVWPDHQETVQRAIPANRSVLVWDDQTMVADFE
ncbi:CRTAC1 family protein [Ahniella affigens]|uniref:CRTAC1 family protein n=1 Tax=Ahniella affigens TaxID=2021234 RepID=UPI00147317B0|nr:CRTAC1 family protein [Ahniella affigens]